MKFLIVLLLSTVCCTSAVVTQNGGASFKTTKTIPARQTLLFEQMTNSSSLTISCWVKYNWTDAGVNSQLGAGAFQGLVSKGVFNNAPSTLQFGLSSASEKIGFSFSSPAATYHIWRTTANSVQTNSWMHIACSYTYSNAASLKFFINGEQPAGSWGTGTGNAVGQTNAVSFHTFLYQATASSFFGGAMSELAIWTNILETAQIVQLSKSRVKYMPLQISPSKLLFYWPMDTWPHVSGAPVRFNSDVDRTLNHFDLDAGGTFYGERALSYYPNE